MYNLGDDLSDKQINLMIKEADSNGDGLVDFEGQYKFFTHFFSFLKIFRLNFAKTQFFYGRFLRHWTLQRIGFIFVPFHSQCTETPQNIYVVKNFDEKV